MDEVEQYQVRKHILLFDFNTAIYDVYMAIYGNIWCIYSNIWQYMAIYDSNIWQYMMYIYGNAILSTSKE